MIWFDIAEELLPPVYKAIKDMYAYAKALNGELLDFVAYMNHIRDNFFIQTCDLETIEYWENLLGIVLYGTETIEQRRENIFLYLNNQTPFTEPVVRKRLDDYFGEGNYSLWFDVDNGKPYDMHLDIYNGDKNYIDMFLRWLNKFIPAHINIYGGTNDQAEMEFEAFLNAESDYSTVATIELVTSESDLYLGSTPETFTVLEI